MSRDKVIIDPKQRTLLDIKACLKLNKNEDDGQPLTIHKLLVGKIVECELKFRLIIEVLII